LLILPHPWERGHPLSFFFQPLAISEKILYSFHNPDKLELTSWNREGAKVAKEIFNSVFLNRENSFAFLRVLRALAVKISSPVGKNCIL
jgi:hypothetical protein